MHIYEAKIKAFSYFAADYDDEDLAIAWPCGKQTKLENNSLNAIGTAIGEHAIECEVCNTTGTRRK